VATKRECTPIRITLGGRAWCLALLMLVSAARAGAQELPAPPPRPREVLKSAVDLYKRSEYEAAAALFAQAQARQADLSATEKQDLASYSIQNSNALRGRRDGSLLVGRAGEALQQGKLPEASNFLKTANANQYLAPAERQRLAELNRQMQAAAAGAGQGAKVDGRALLAAARTALQQGDLDGADGLAAKAEQAGSGVPAWLKPWEDSPAKVRRDVQATRQKLNPPRPAEPVTAKESPWSFPSMKGLFGRGSDKPAPASEPRVAEFPGAPPRPVEVATKSPPPEQKPPTAAPLPLHDRAAAGRAQARQLLREGYRALEANDIDKARRFAFQAKELHADLDRNELGPEQLLNEIQRRSAAAAAAPDAKPADSRALVREARLQLQKDQLAEVDRLLSQAEAIAGTSWGLFEDSPEKLRRELLKARARHEREESVKVLAEARKLMSKGDYEQAKLKAWHAQKLHGPYGTFDFGDRPQRLLDEIQRAELKKQNRIPGKDEAQLAQNTARPAAKNTAPKGRAGSGAANPITLVSATAQNETKNRAAALVREARALEQQGQMFEALQKANEARQLPVTFAADEDSPGAVLQSLAGQCNRQVQKLLLQAADKVGSGGEPARLQAAALDLEQARRLAQAFGLDTQQVDQKALWLQQVAANHGAAPVPERAQLPDPASLHKVAAVDPEVARRQQAGMEKLNKSRLELRAGNYGLARKMAEEALEPAFGVQGEAEMVLRSIYAEEENQRVLAARRTFDAGADAYSHGNFTQAMNLFAALDPKLLPPDAQARLRELVGSKEMQPSLVRVAHQDATGAPLKEAPGKAQVSDAGSPAYLDSVRAMEEVQFQQLRERGLQAQRTAMDLFKAGEKVRAVETLEVYLKTLETAQLDAERGALLRKQVENRVQQYRTLVAQDILSAEKGRFQSPAYAETQKQLAQQKSQKDVADLMKQYNALMKEGKEDQAWALASKASELEPDNPTLKAAIEISKIKSRQKEFDKVGGENEKYFIKALDSQMGPFPTETEPFAMNKDGIDRINKRKYDKNGIWSETRTSIERAIEYKLNEPITLNFKDTPLQQVIEDLRSMTGLNIVPHTRALHEAGISLDQPLSLSVHNIPLKSALNHLLGKVKLTYAIKENVLQITTEDDGKGKIRTVVYSVADLVVPVDNHTTPDVSNLEKVLGQLQPGRPALGNYGPTPLNGPMTLPPGQQVSSSSSGLGAGNAGSSSMASGTTYGPRIAGGTIEDQLMSLIKNTVARDTWDDVGGQGKVQYFPLGMALVINQTQEAQEEITQLLAALRRLQDLEVSIEMRLVSVSESFFEFMGVNFDVNLQTPKSRNEADLVNSAFVQQPFVNRSLSGVNAVTGLQPSGTLTPDLNIPIKNTSFGFANPPFGGYPGTVGADGGLSLGLAFLSEIQVFMFMEAAQGDKRTQIMQAPKITVFNGQTAFLSVNQQQFFMTNMSVTLVNGQFVTTPVNSPIPLGVTMQVTPVVSADRRFVRLNLTPSLTNLTNASVPLFPVQVPVPQILQGPGLGVTAVGQPVIFQFFLQQPSIQSISLSTTVNVPDGGTVLLGGLKTMSEGRNEFGPPVLSKIPYISRLFKNVGYGRDAQSLMIMVTPRIIINEEEEQVFTGERPPIPRP
jgi:type II secretory pathway component GspD/PulD (secretin)